MSGKVNPTRAVQQQIVLPMSKAAEIAYKNIRLRLSRSLLVTSGIVLALAFLNSILVTDAMTRAMREWVDASTTSPRFMQLQTDRRDLEKRLPELAERVRETAVGKSVGGDGEKARWESARDRVGTLPLPIDQMIAVDSSEAGRAATGAWESAAEQLTAARAELNSPRLLEAMMKKNGIPTTPDEIRNDRIQTRWKLGLALLVAFIGILNAMLMSVTERFREIGTMKCLGALDGFIIRLFLLESLFQGVVGTMIGVVIGTGLGMIVQTVSFGSYAWKNMPVHDLLMAVVICFAAGIGLTVAGAVYPAWRAARMQPIAAMRVEA